MSRPLRSSCDRCHSQKLKCPKEPGLFSCTRCLKAGSTCVFSPAGPSIRRANTPTTAFLDGSLSSLDMQFDWSCPGPGNSLGADPPEFIMNHSQPDVSQSAETEPDPVSQDPRSICVRQLTTLAAELDQVSLDLTSVLHIHIPQNELLEDGHAKLFGHFARRGFVDRLFILVQRLTEIYPQALELLFDTLNPPQCQDPDCFHTLKIPNELHELFSGLDDNQNEVDVFLFNLLVLCHGKVVDVMGSLILCARLCSLTTVASPSLHQSGAHISEVRIGSFVANNSAASTMQVVLLIHLTSVLLDYSRQLSERTTKMVEHESNSKQGQVLLLQCQILEEKVVGKKKLLEKVKVWVAKPDIVKLLATSS
ncbi:uncharacterized protein GGS25DRAFT_507901 [Hypoxylon fragiforme]|uniref:uncharacterized protein n=1 Tax=Hypoxylon fragiforme TaxID=63214 RepID=UPI0020C6CA1E|nr:uncharacterized protein GGS25DRAFT_507901 [Hypoxylon fragiforme]KAI2604357.1 hypothetical protein GGS25DRAFT_507901 [Hypoxylon fragiforme]